MIRTLSSAALAVFIVSGVTSQGWGGDLAEGRVAAERLLGSDGETAQMQSYLPFIRTFGTSGVVAGSLEASTAAAGVPLAAMLEALRALSASIDVERDLQDGDRFYVRYEQTFTVEDRPIGVGRVLWAELRTASKGTIAIHRFRAARTSTEPFWLASGQATATPAIQLPLKTISVTSGFGLRADPMDQPAARIPMGPLGPAPVMPNRSQSNSRPGSPNLKPSPLAGEAVNVATPLGQAFGLAPGAWRPTTTPSSSSSSSSLSSSSRSSSSRTWAMHQGVDLVAAPGTAILAAGDGIVLGAAPNGRYGNWIEIEHDGNLSTVYGHLSGFAPGIAPGVRVSQGEVIGFSGNTGRSTGPHLHFEVLTNGRPANPIGHAATRRAQLRGPDLERFRRQVASDLQMREREAGPL